MFAAYVSPAESRGKQSTATATEGMAEGGLPNRVNTVDFELLYGEVAVHRQLAPS